MSNLTEISRASDAKETLARLRQRASMACEEERKTVRAIIEDVRKNGDDAILTYTKRFDKVSMAAAQMRVSEREIDRAISGLDPLLLQTMRRSAQNIRAFHEKQRQNSWMTMDNGRLLGQLIRPLASVGIYVPGGRAAYPSSVLMNAIPAQAAGVNRIVMTTPPERDGSLNPLVLAAAREAGVQEIYKIGGAQAIAALAYGTRSIAGVDKITGPGNLYVALAKREVFGQVGIDMIAGPSEVLIIADDTANAAYTAADMLAQAEHDPLAASVLITTSERLAKQVCHELERQLVGLPRAQIAGDSLNQYGAILLAESKEESLKLANQIAPEHLELLVANPLDWLDGIQNAGAIFMGAYTPEAVGDYMAGPNHVLPTNASARFFSPLSVDDFVKKSSLLRFSKEALRTCWQDVARFADAEGLQAHARSAAIRFGHEEPIKEEI